MAGFGYLDQNVKVVCAFGYPATPLLTKDETRKTLLPKRRKKSNIVKFVKVTL